ncbi:hypothetical protein BDY21DRAFT_117179 [Lineolata rhizophorae]|uniref:Riboflavin kinase n=1 Tax=Lineolata rhizophorae TaxID=578093 RepID=A0A6A6NPW0_9PEZI|nr:hypothetical protein BDY21DRAFT_117179 [Lineolata rhizophorae]
MQEDNAQRPLVAGPDDGPEPPFPIRVAGKVIKGFGRGSKELGIPTANIPITGLSVGGHSDLSSGVYLGWAGLNPLSDTSLPSDTSTSTSSASAAPPHTYAAVLSIGYNPFYKNTARSVEVYLINDFGGRDFYGAELRLLILGYVRPELDYVSVEKLIEDIRTDIRVAERSLGREAWRRWREEEWLVDWGRDLEVVRPEDVGITG